MSLLATYYYEYIYTKGLAEFDDLSEDSKQYLENTLGYRQYRLAQAFKDLGTAIGKTMPAVGRVNKALWKNWGISTTNRFERFCLFFIRRRFKYDEIENTTVVYKRFRGKLFILDFWVNPPVHWNCRCTVVPLND